VTGDDLLALGYPPGAQFKTILDYVEDARLEGRVASREAALALIRQTFPPPPGRDESSGGVRGTEEGASNSRTPRTG
jgi:hypothetical protein